MSIIADAVAAAAAEAEDRRLESIAVAARCVVRRGHSLSDAMARMGLDRQSSEDTVAVIVEIQRLRGAR